jgi:hypothetical protein
MEPDAFDRFLERIFGAKRLFHSLGAIALMLAGVAWIWFIGRHGFLIAIPGLIMIGLGIGLFGLILFSEDSGYNF